jgi:ureidoglycolate dehydrogenase (NAD+)
VIDATALGSWASAVMERAGLTARDARTVADVLLHASLRGVDSHGIARLPGYVEDMLAGKVNLRPQPHLLPGDGALRLFDGDNGPGPVAAVPATDAAIDLAHQHGVSVVSVRGSQHFGAASFYARRIAESRLLGMAMTNAPTGVVPYGGASPVLGTNPIAFAAPLEDGTPWDLDMATSQVALNKIINARDWGRDIPLGWGVDSEGNPTTDAQQATAAVPLGGYKGYALALMVEVLCALLPGATSTGDSYDNTGHFLLALDPERTVGAATFAQRLAGLLGRLRGTAPAAGFEEVLVPGDPEARAQRTREREGIPLDPALHERLRELAVQLEIPLPEAEGGTNAPTWKS